MTLRARMRKGILLRAGHGALGIAMALALLPGLARAQTVEGDEAPVLLELYTAQGCASCPPADQMLSDIAARDDVIALALHVDYWDYIGWADTFADRAYTERQQRYARRFGHSTIYTPQVVINGTQIVEGFRVVEVMQAIETAHARTPEVILHLARTESGLEIRAVPGPGAAPQIAMASRRSALSLMASNAVIGSLRMRPPEDESAAPAAELAEAAEPAAGAGALDLSASASAPAAPAVVPPRPTGLGPVGTGPYSVQLVRYRPHDTVDILDGENAGLTASYANIVTSWEAIGSWDMLAPLDLTLPLEGDLPVVVLVQESGQGEIIAAQRLR